MSLRLARALRAIPKTSITARAVAVPRLAYAPTINPIRNFSSTPLRLGSGESDGPLAAALAAEHKYEVDENSAHPETPDFLETFRTQGTWEIKSSTGVDDVSLIRQFGAETLKLTFQISDIDTPLAEETEPAVQQEDDLAPPPVITCSLVVSKGSHENSLSIDLEAGEEGFAITNLAVFPKSLAEAEGSEGDWARRSRYLGPQFDQLDESLQETFAAFLAERGVDESLSNFIISFAEYKEQKDYISWLADAKAFVEQ